MHGYDWKALGERYRALLPHVAHRSDLNYVLGEMVAELSVGHAYIEGGDYEIPPRPKLALPGARFELDLKAGRYRIARIFAGQNEEEQYRSPLTETGVDAKLGDYVLEIDGVALAADDDPYRLLRHKTDPVTLTLNARPTLEGARKTTYRPIASEESLLYLEFVTAARARVARLTNGRAGYIHIPDMGSAGSYEFLEVVLPGGGQGRPGGGRPLERRRQHLAVGDRSADPEAAGHQLRADRQPARHLPGRRGARRQGLHPQRDLGLGRRHLPVHVPAGWPRADQGKRSWGGVVGISGRGPLVDGGRVFVPEDGTNDAAGRWVIEGHGVDPDIVVENDPKSVIAGRDPQLERAVSELVKAMDAAPAPLPPRPADPVKTK